MKKKKQSTFNERLIVDPMGMVIVGPGEPIPKIPNIRQSKEYQEVLERIRRKELVASLETAEKKPLQEIIEARLEKIA